VVKIISLNKVQRKIKLDMASSSHCEPEPDFVPPRSGRHSDLPESGPNPEEGGDQEYVPARSSRHGGDLSDLTSTDSETINAQIREAQDVINNPEQMKKIMRELTSKPEEFKSAVRDVESNPHLKRKAMRLTDRSDVREKVNKMSMKEKKKIAKNFQERNKGKVIPTMRGAGYDAVIINISRKYKQVILEGPDFLGNAKYIGWTTIDLKEGIRIIFDPSDQTKNRKATAIAGVPVGGKHLIYRLDEDGRFLHLKVATLELYYK
jgi:hypothetical protein